MKYCIVAEVFDLGPFITKVILDLQQTVTENEINQEAFKVEVARKDKKTGEILKLPKSWGSEEKYPSVGERKVVAAYISDYEGRRSPRGAFITLEMEVDPRIPIGATIAFNGTFNEQVNCEYRITQLMPVTDGNITLNDMVFNELNKQQTLLADEFITGESAYEGIHLKYAAYEPQSNGIKRPLLIWLHGAGEGGRDPIIAISGNKVVNLITEGIQKFFGGSYVLGPQSPTMWMDDGTGRYNTDGTSMYIGALKHLIDEYIAEHDDIDRNRIYIGGCSNGGFMTMKMIIAYPRMFAAAYPICEALTDIHITDDEINKIKALPIWFTHAVNDPIVDFNKHSAATFDRLLKAGAPNVHFSSFPSVSDQTGKYFNADGTSYEYNGHFSWIPALNNECTLDYDNKPVMENGREVTLFEWLSMQKKDRE